MTRNRIAQPYRARNDINGNPRKLLVVLDTQTGRTVKVIDPGYMSDYQALDQEYGGGHSVTLAWHGVDITVSEYRRLLRLGASVDSPSEGYCRMHDMYDCHFAH